MSTPIDQTILFLQAIDAIDMYRAVDTILNRLVALFDDEIFYFTLVEKALEVIESTNFHLALRLDCFSADMR